ncbi:MAG: hypothetical protein ACREWI_00975 [Telluria sp.]
MPTFKKLNKRAVRSAASKRVRRQGNKVIVLGHGAWTARDTGPFREFMDAHVAVEAFECYPLAAGQSQSLRQPAA